MPSPSLLLAVCCLVSGYVHAAAGAPLAQAQVVLAGLSRTEATSDSRGSFSVTVPPGRYVGQASVRGYAPVRLVLDVDRDTILDFALQPLDAPTLRTIGTVSINGRLAPSSGTIPSIDVSRADFDRLGLDRVVDGLKLLPSVTFTRPDGGASSAIAVTSLRGPDPSETLIALDGQLLNDANTGDIDLSRFPVAAFSSVDVSEGLGPRDREGSNTIGGAIDLVSLQPTRDSHVAYSLSTGSFGANEAWLNASGTRGRLGYALGADDQHEAGYVNQNVLLLGATPTHLGSTVESNSALVNLAWTFSQNADVGARVFSLGNVRDQSGAINGIDGHPTITGANGSVVANPNFGQFIGPGDQTFAQDVRAYLIHARMPFGAGELTAQLANSDNAVTLTGGAASPYDLTHQDRRTTGGLTWERTFERATIAFGGYTQNESFNAAGTFPTLGQSIDSAFVRAGVQPSTKLHLDGDLVESHYTTFGSNLDGRFGGVYDADPKTALRFSIGTGFRAPLLVERYVFPLDQLPPPDANCVQVGQGNPNEAPERATEYELGASHQFANATLDASLYWTNLRNPIETFYPLGTQGPDANGTCAQTFTSFPVNVGNVVYKGAEVRYVQRLVSTHLFLTALYGLNVAYPSNLGANVSNPTSGGNLVNGEQFLGIPQQQGSLALDYAVASWHAAVAATFRGHNNELNQPPFSLLDAAVGRQLTPVLDLTLAGTNLFNSVAGRYTIFGGGVPYRGVGGSNIAPTITDLATDARFIDPASVRVILTVRR